MIQRKRPRRLRGVLAEAHLEVKVDQMKVKMEMSRVAKSIALLDFRSQRQSMTSRSFVEHGKKGESSDSGTLRVGKCEGLGSRERAALQLKYVGGPKCGSISRLFFGDVTSCWAEGKPASPWGEQSGFETGEWSATWRRETRDWRSRGRRPRTFRA